jgi:hypothetical protein
VIRRQTADGECGLSEPHSATNGLRSETVAAINAAAQIRDRRLPRAVPTAYPMIVTFRPTRAASQGHLGRPRRRPGTRARSARPTSRAARGSASPTTGPARFGAAVSAAPMATVRTPTRTAARVAASGVTSPLASRRTSSRPERTTLSMPCRCARGACSRASSRAYVGPPQAPLRYGESGALGSPLAWHLRPSR